MYLVELNSGFEINIVKWMKLFYNDMRKAFERLQSDILNFKTKLSLAYALRLVSEPEVACPYHGKYFANGKKI